MVRLYRAVAAICLVVTVCSLTWPIAAAIPTAKRVIWQTDLKLAQKIAQRGNKPILIVMGGPKCVFCKKLENETLGQTKLAQYINEQFVAVHLDYERDNRVAKVLDVKSLPTTVILSPEADLLGTVEGFVDAKTFSAALVSAKQLQTKIQQSTAKR